MQGKYIETATSQTLYLVLGIRKTKNQKSKTPCPQGVPSLMCVGERIEGVVKQTQQLPHNMTDTKLLCSESLQKELIALKVHNLPALKKVKEALQRRLCLR